MPHATGHGWNQPSGAIALTAMKAESGWGTVAVQITDISPDSDMANYPLERIWDDGDIPRHAARGAAIKAHGSLAAIELGHGGMRAQFNQWLAGDWRQCLTCATCRGSCKGKGDGFAGY